MAVKAKMLQDEFIIFKGPLKDNTGKTVIASGVALSQQNPVLESMNYLVDGVIGQI